MAPVRFAGFCVRPSKPPNPNFSESLSFPWFLLHWALRESLREGAVSVCPPGSCWAPLVSPGAEVLMSFKRCFEMTLSLWLGCVGTGQWAEQTGWVWVCVCLLSRVQLPCPLVSEHKGEGTASGHQPAFSKTLSQLILWLCCLLRDNTAHTACKFIPYLVLLKRLGQHDSAESLKFLLWMTLKEQTSRKAFSVAEVKLVLLVWSLPTFPLLPPQHKLLLADSQMHIFPLTLHLSFALSNKEFVQLSGLWWKHWAPCRADLQHFPCCSIEQVLT